MDKRGQAATEFLLTHGWAFMCILAAVAALAYFGVLQPDRYMPERCAFPAGMDCIDKAVVNTETDQVTFALKNNVGSPVNITGVDVSLVKNCGGVARWRVDDLAWGETARIDHEQGFIVTVECTKDITAGKFYEEVVVTYRNTDTGLSHPAVGEIRARA